MDLQTRIIFDIESPPDAIFNMAADLTLLDWAAVQDGVWIRFYRWQKPSITLGYMQQPSQSLDHAALERAGGCWIRRPTGGRAVLHAKDLTYSVVFSKSVRAMGSELLQTYKIISDCLMAGLSSLAIHCTPHDALIDPTLARQETRLPCFLAPNREEIMVEGKKLIGSAQKRQEKAVLQHGSIPFGTAFRQLPDYSPLSDEDRRVQTRLLHSKCCCINEISPALTIQGLAEGLAGGFEQLLPWHFERESWSSIERSTIEEFGRSEPFVQRFCQ